MVTGQQLQLMLQGKLPSFLFVCEARVQVYELDNESGLIVTTSRDAAKICAADLVKRNGKRVSISEVGCTPGGSLAAQTAMAVLEHGITGLYVSDDGETFTYFQAPPVPE